MFQHYCAKNDLQLKSHPYCYSEEPTQCKWSKHLNMLFFHHQTERQWKIVCMLDNAKVREKDAHDSSEQYPT